MNIYLRITTAAAWWFLALGLAEARYLNTTCDRTCLETLLSDYLDALVANSPTRLPTTPCVKYVENSQILPLGAGEWQTADTLGKYRHVFSDPQSRQVAAITTITENGVGAIYVVRLKVENDGKISEIETQITRDPNGAALYENMTSPEAVWSQPVPMEQRIPREKLIAQADKYYTGMQRNDPNGNYSFFDKDCNRLEDGLQTTNQHSGDAYGHSNDTAFASLGCEAQFQTGFLGFVTHIRDRRYPVVDEERQAVLAITIFDHNGTVRSLPSVNGTSSPIPAYFDVPRTLAASEAFRMRGEKLYRIEMTLTEVPYGMRSAFAADPPSNHTGPGTTISAPTQCNRACLEATLDEVLYAMQKNDTSTLPLSPRARYSENGQFLAIGDGLWETLRNVSKPGLDQYAARFADEASGTAGYWGLTTEHTTPGVLALRVKVDNGSITEIEAVNVRAESSGSRGGTMTLMRPPLPVEWEGDPLGRLDGVFGRNASGGGSVTKSMQLVMNGYLDGLEGHSSRGVPFTPSCIRRDNGFQGNVSCAAQMNGNGVAPNGLFNITTTVRDRRILVADAGKGVVMAVAMVDDPASGLGIGPLNVTLNATEKVPSTYMIPQLVKINNGSISRVESMIKWMPFGYTSAWMEENGMTGSSNCSVSSR